MFPVLSNYQMVLVLSTMFLLLMWVFESFFLIKLYGKIKRGFKIWSKPLSNEAREYLINPANNIIVPHQINWGAPYYSFILLENNEVIVRPFTRAIFPIVGYVNLLEPNARLEYRGGVSHFLVFLLAFAYSYYFFILLYGLIVIINYLVLVRNLDDYLNKKVVHAQLASSRR